MTEQELVEKARADYQTNDIQIDNDAHIQEVDDGYWVAAYVWIGKEDE